MRRAVRRVVVAVVVTGALLVAAPGASAQAEGPAQALQAICEHVDGGEWTPQGLRCFTGLDRTVSLPAQQLCNHAIGELLVFIVARPEGIVGYGWNCAPS